MVRPNFALEFLLPTILCVCSYGVTLQAQSLQDHSDSNGVIVADEGTRDPCQAEVIANPTRPNWDTSATTTACNVLEADLGWLRQPMDAQARQQQIVSSLRYGLTPKLDLRYGFTELIHQYGDGQQALSGIGDQTLSFRFRFLEQAHWYPAMALSYGYKFPTASADNGFGSGYADHQFLLILSRDLGKNHFDYNLLGTLAGAANGFDSSVQSGLALTRAITPRFSGILESYGGTQPGVPDRYGANLVGCSYQLTPRLYLDASWARAYTAGSPRDLLGFGVTYARPSGLPPLSHKFAAARWLGR